ncbi:TPA: hypothetical protein ACNTDP_005043, partial [Escherichia coli]
RVDFPSYARKIVEYFLMGRPFWPIISVWDLYKKGIVMRTFKGVSDQTRKPISNVVPIRPGGGVASNDDDSGVTKAKWIAGAAAKGLGSVLRSLSFLIMLWLRLPVRLLLIATSAMAFIGVVLCLVIFSDRSMVPGFIIIGLASTALAWLYDLVLTKLTQTH